MSKIPSQQVEWTRMGLEQQSDALGKWHYPADGTSDNDDRPEAAKETIPVQMPLKNWRFQPGKASYKKAASAATTPR
ncbi:hypothetical protein RB195_018582 [Necator americanus]|uniref:Uncharacterized protein n=1 Tax=Necator americanus TaxID=51031 RepID=A0ABR1CCC0_NECAM